MIFWNRKDVYFLMSAEEREEYIYNSVSLKMFRFLNFLSFLLNVFIVLVLYYFVGFNLIALGIGFIISDILLNVFDQILFITIPYLTTCTKSTTKLNRRLHKIEKHKGKTEHQITILRTKECKKCNFAYEANNCYRCKHIEHLQAKIKRLNEIIEIEKQYISELQNKTEVKILTKEKKNSIGIEQNTEKENYFTYITERFSELIGKENLNFLIGLKKNTKSLSQILNNKPELETEIPLTIYSKLDDMLTISYNYIKLKPEEQKEQLEDIKKFTDLLIKETLSIILKINHVKTPQKNDIRFLLNKYNKQEEQNV
jgi:hypothetical protein